MQIRLVAGGGHGKRLVVETNLPWGPDCHDRHCKGKSSVVSVEGLLGRERGAVQASCCTESLQEVLEAEMTEALGAEQGRAQRRARLGYRSGYYGRTLVTRVGKLELRVPQDRDGRFSTELFERYQRSEKALVAALAEMYVQGVSTRKVKAITEELCGHASRPARSARSTRGWMRALARFASRPLDEAYPYLILDARYERVREGGVIAQPGGADRDRHQLGRPPPGAGGRARQPREPIELAGLPAAAEGARPARRRVRRLRRPRRPAGRRCAELLPEAAWQRCYVHFLRNALDHLPRKADDDCLQELRWLYDRRDLTEAQARPGRLAHAAGSNAIQALRLGRGEHRRDADLLPAAAPAPQAPEEHQHAGALNEEIKRRTHVVRIFPNAASCLRLVRALASRPTRTGSRSTATSTWTC